MKIGVTVFAKHSFFSAGSPQTSLAIAEVLRMKGHETFFINISPHGFWEDCSGLRTEVIVKGIESVADCDVVIEVGGHLLPLEHRRKAKKAVWMCRKSPLFHDIESTLYPFSQNPKRDLEGISEIWVFDEMVTKDDIQYLELLTRKPVKKVPFLWSPSAVEAHRRDMKSPIWQQVYELPEVKEKPWSIHICETNTSSSSSCTIPLFIMREVKLKTDISLTSIKIHNAENVKDGNFFKDNVHSHAFDEIKDLSSVFVGRQRVIDYVYDPMSIVVSHSRFIALRPYLLELAWVGVPFLHNSKILKCLGGLVSEGFYPDNEIVAGKEAFVKLVKKARESNVETILEMRKAILDRFTPISPSIQEAWDTALKGIPEMTPQLIEKKDTNTLRVGFCDMWDSFNPEYNQFTLMLQASQPGKKVVGLDITNYPPGKEECDILVFGPFGQRWRDVKEIPKIHFTGENTNPIPGIALNLGFKHMDGTGEEYLRLPLWMLEINWFHGDVDRIQNPKPIPIERCTKPVPEEVYRKKKFCAFVVTNPKQPMRNNAFQWLSRYKKIDSAGRLFNNMGESIFAGLGGGGGELKKFEFLKDYKFCLTFENESSPGYVTEKMLHAKAAGCIPIYWGDPKVERDFDVNGFIDAREVTTAQELIELVSKVDNDTNLYLKKYSIPALDEVARDRVRRTLGECARRIWKLVGVTEGCPDFIGYTEDSKEKLQEEKKEEKKKEEKKEEKKEKKEEENMEEIEPNNSTLIVTACNTRFLPSFEIWLQSMSQMRIAKNARVRVYLMADVEEEKEKQIKEQHPYLEVERFPTETPETFPDLWDPQHFAWKIWIYQELVKKEKGLVLYIDSGVFFCRWPEEWLNKAKTEGLCVLEDPRQKNIQWCHDIFKQEMKMTKEELEAQQIVAGIMAFIGNHHVPKKIFEEAWVLAQRKDIITGPKFGGFLNGKIYGHRHDQSILSLLTFRNNVPTYPLDKVYCDRSLRHTFMKGAYLYTHRGRFIVHQPITDHIDDAWVINLDRREDRLEKFKKTHPNLAEKILRLSAFEGVNLTLTPKLARLFAPHDFKWKKAVMGCALSHLALWLQLANDKPDIQSYLILEDDAKLSPHWQEKWDDMVKEKCLPEDWDVMYLGGILPPNKEGFETVVETVNDYVGRIRENTIFGQRTPNRYFHFCAYAYVLSRRGAQKILEVLRVKDGYWTSADHMICNIHEVLNIYFLHPLVAGCYQDDDPVYQQSQFNDFSRKDKFDSDLWNNNEHFSPEEVSKVLKKDDSLDLIGALQEARQMMKKTEKKETEKKETEKKETNEQSTTSITLTKPKRRLVSLCKRMNMNDFYEFSWFKQLLLENAQIPLEIEEENGLPDDEPIVIYQRPVEPTLEILKRWKEAGKKFYLLHVSDEFCNDDISLYNWKECLGVIRNYVREDAPNSDKIKTIPLGFHWAIKNGDPYIHTPQPPFREYVWSFVGTGWCGRRERLEVLKGIPGDNKLVFQDGWDSADKLGREELLGIMLNSWFLPCPGGQNPETFRIYEALEAGAMPVIVKEGGFEPLLGMLTKWMPLLIADNWFHAAQLIHSLKSKPEIYEQYRLQVLMGWEACKKDVKEWIKNIYQV